MPKALPKTMKAVLLKGYGGFDQLDYRQDVAVPAPQAGEVLIQVAAAGINNTDINTRTGWYSKGVSEGTTAEAGNQVMRRSTPSMGEALHSSQTA